MLQNKVERVGVDSTELDNVQELIPDWVARALNKQYRDVMNEPIPEDFKQLLKQLDDKG